MKERLTRLQEDAGRAGLQAVALVPGPNLRYLSGMEMGQSERPTLLILPVTGEPLAICPGFEAARLQETAGVATIFGYSDEVGPAAALEGALAAFPGLGGGTWGLEYGQMRLLERELLGEAIAKRGHSLAYRDAGPLLAGLRMRKDAAEAEALARAAALTDEGMRLAREAIRPGVAELQVVAAVVEGLKRAGLRTEPEMLVASGPRGAVPHAEATDRVMQEGELCWVDLFFRHEGYVGDITRTFAVGAVETVPEQLRRAYRVVQEAQARGRAAARPGATGAQVDAAAREHIASEGFGEYFTHRTGHGIGLEIHEEPYMVAGATRPLEEGMAFTVEPGIYIPGLGGIRIEDDLLLTADGAQVLTRYPRELTGTLSRAIRAGQD